MSMANMLKIILPSANTLGALCITFSVAGVEPVATDKKPIKKNAKRYIQVAGRLLRYFNSKRNISKNITVGFKVFN